jgi:hypothetical protein
VFGRLWQKLRGAPRDDDQALDADDDPRGDVPSEEYRRADPRDIVQEGDVVMSGPGGTPQDEEPKR